MYSVTKEFTFDYAHRLLLDYPSKCSNIHGHTAKVQITLVTDEFVEPQNNILVNFVDLKDIINEIKEDFDHKMFLNHNDLEFIKPLQTTTTNLVIMNANPTSETFARVICMSVADKLVKFMVGRNVAPSKDMVIKVSFWETPTSFATYMDSMTNIMKIKMNCKHEGCKCKGAEKSDHKCKCKCKDKKKDKEKDSVNEYVKVSVVRTKNLVPVSEETARRMAERGMLLGKLKKKSEEKKESKIDSNPNVKPLVNSVLRNLLK